MLVRLTAEGQALAAATAGRFADDVTALLGQLTARDQATLARLVSRLLVGYAAGHGIDLFADLLPAAPAPAAGAGPTAPRTDT